MRATREKGFTLVEMLLAITIIGIIAGALMPLLSAMLNAHTSLSTRSSIHREGLLIMERITSGLKKTTVVAVPNGHKSNRDILAFSRLVNTDNDFYFGDPLFPRIDEDPGSSYSSGGYGIPGLDEDDDGQVDETHWRDDDEDGLVDEDLFDGLDNDGDGTIDEEALKDYDGSGTSGIPGIDDDGDGTVDEQQGSQVDDDDEDGTGDEEEILFVVYTYDQPTKTLTEIHSNPNTGINSPAPQIVLSTRVAHFMAKYKTPTRIRVELNLVGEDDKTLDLVEEVYVRNVLQKTGKRAR